MIKINVITNNKNWLNYIKKPNYYLDKKIKISPSSIFSKLDEIKINKPEINIATL